MEVIMAELIRKESRISIGPNKKKRSKSNRF